VAGKLGKPGTTLTRGEKSHHEGFSWGGRRVTNFFEGFGGESTFPGAGCNKEGSNAFKWVGHRALAGGGE